MLYFLVINSCKIRPNTRTSTEQFLMKAMTHIADGCHVCQNQIKPMPEWSIPRNRLLKKINFPEVIWDGISCSICRESPLVGNAFKCFECEGVISCESCSETGKHAHDLHYLSSKVSNLDKNQLNAIHIICRYIHLFL